METRAHHVLIGAFTLAMIVFALLFALWAGKFTGRENWREYEVRFSEAVTGLAEGGSVQYNGIGVGTVRRLSLAPDDPRQVIARIRIHADAPVREDTIAQLGLTGLTGIAFVQLTGGSPGSPLLKAQPGQEAPVIQSRESALQKLLSSSEDIATTASEVLIRLRNILSDENAARLAHTLASVDAFTEAVAGEREEIAALIRNARAASERLERVLGSSQSAMERLDASLTKVDTELLAQLPEITRDLRQSLERLRALSERADRMLAENEDALASFGGEGLSQLGPTLLELRQLIHDLGRLSNRIESNPTRFLLGGDQPEEYQPE